jgi:hypothetical protein
MNRCYGHKGARTTENRAIVTEDTSIEFGNKTTEIIYAIDLFYLLK